MKKPINRHVEQRVAELIGLPTTYGRLEELAGITDRQQFWKGKSEEAGRDALRQLIRERVVKGVL